MALNQTDLNSALRPSSQTLGLHSQTSVVHSTVTRALTLVGEKTAEQLGAPEIGTFKPLTAEQAAGNILGFIQRQIERDIANGATDEELEARLQAGLSGFNKGFNEARDRLEALSLLDGNVSASIGKTYDLVTSGIDQLAQDHLGRSLTDIDAPKLSQIAPNTAPTQARYEYASAQSFRFELLTAEGDKVSIQANASRGETHFWRAEDGSSSSASSSSVSYSLNVTGELNDTEQTAINELLQQVNSLADSFFSGDIANAFASALELGYDRSQIEGFALNLTRVDIQRVSSAYDGNGSPPNSLQQSLQPVGQFINDAQEALNQADHFAEPHKLLLDIVDGLYGDAEAPGNQDGQSFADFIAELLDTALPANNAPQQA
ncbi:DUF5610 domain-containing protein [Gilvimarinus polysaccharolyticus]|uniref:DUF5610 domain-containing protein n=1 Tax=Gilvimarinus polysaccharolyticus TaxID=863921 RepID=UPI000673B9D2|nr:DUF5610 domain-containing protein [Gilvimarinus polysaccharolyticus]